MNEFTQLLLDRAAFRREPEHLSVHGAFADRSGLIELPL
jgi:hypothetical protein